MSRSEVSVHKREVRQIWVTSAKPQTNEHTKHLKNISNCSSTFWNHTKFFKCFPTSDPFEFKFPLWRNRRYQNKKWQPTIVWGQASSINCSIALQHFIQTVRNALRSTSNPLTCRNIFQTCLNPYWSLSARDMKVHTWRQIKLVKAVTDFNSKGFTYSVSFQSLGISLALLWRWKQVNSFY